MTKMTVNGISTTQSGMEQYETFYINKGRKRIARVMYDYRTASGELFSTVAPSVKICRQRRDEWILKHNFK